MNSTCILCGSQDHRTVFEENGIPIVECSFCEHVYSTYNQEEHYEGYWDDPNEEYDLEWWDKAHRPIYKEFISKFLTEDSGILLDVGCGLGYFIKKVGESKKQWKLTGYEISEKAVAFAHEMNGLTNVHSGRVQDSRIQSGSLDIITLWDVIEHIPKPQPLLEYLNKLLKPGGKIFIQTPNFPFQLWKARLKVQLEGMHQDGHYLEAKDHVNNYKMETIIRLGEQCGFQSPMFFILKPIMSIAGSNSKIGIIAKIVYYYLSKFVFWISFKRWNISNTLFITMVKP